MIDLPTELPTPRGMNEISADDLERYTKFYESRLAFYGYDDREPWNRKAIATYCAKYFAGSMKKGLALVGDTGLGKTMAMRIMCKMFGLRLYVARELVEKWQLLGIKERQDLWIDLKGNPCPQAWKHEEYEHCWKDIIIDDIGTEPTLNDYGTKSEVIDSVMNRRVKEFENNEAFTFFTFNLPLQNPKMDAECIQGRYGKRFVSRLHQLCHVISLRGPDRRMD